MTAPKARKTAAAKKAVAPVKDAETKPVDDAPEPTADEAVTEGASDAPEPEVEDDTDSDAAPTPEGVPTAAPLKAPVAPVAADPEPEPPHSVGAGWAAEAEVERAPYDGPILYDAATGKAPDVEGLFVKVFEHGSLMRCTKRIVQASFHGPYRHRIDRLVLSQGKQVSIEQAWQVEEALRRQAAAGAEV